MIMLVIGFLVAGPIARRLPLRIPGWPVDKP